MREREATSWGFLLLLLSSSLPSIGIPTIHEPLASLTDSLGLRKEISDGETGEKNAPFLPPDQPTKQAGNRALTSSLGNNIEHSSSSRGIYIDIPNNINTVAPSCCSHSLCLVDCCLGLLLLQGAVEQFKRAWYIVYIYITWQLFSGELERQRPFELATYIFTDTHSIPQLHAWLPANLNVHAGKINLRTEKRGIWRCPFRTEPPFKKESQCS